MSLTEGSGPSSSPGSVALGEVLTFFGMVADYAAGCAPEEGERVSSLAVAMAKIADLSQEDRDALYFAARLRNIGALGNAAFAKGEALSDREIVMLGWDVPADGARLCESIGALPEGTADMVRWQAECWDGTGYPDQLRWAGIPATAQLLNIAQAYVRTTDPEESLSAITLESGCSFAPEQVRTFIMWFHTYGGEIESVAPPYAALESERTTPVEIIERLSELVDAHNATPQRAARVARRAEEIGKHLRFDAETLRQVRLASLLFGIGELRALQAESMQFDPLARLGIDTRAENAVTAARLIAQCPQLADLAPVVRARAEWYDGTGRPDGLRHDAIPQAAHALAVSLSFDAVDEAYRSRITEERALPLVRLETAAGTQFDPAVVRALADVVKARA
ncbi:MAG TPA: HD domain-containing phosphohydrolase [Candidatus Baltobacteraceae bacterium]|nr:HD domain-containing phosphohydrolase [Candidatus Baltobacteraceae bacterium]